MPKSLSILSLTFMMLCAAQGRADTPADWKAYFGLDTAQQKRFSAAEKDKAAKNKPMHDREKQLLETLKQEINSKASDAQISQTFSEIRSDKKAMHAEDEAFLDAIGAFLTPTQEAKWILKNHKPKNGPGSQPAPTATAAQPAKPPEDPAQKKAEAEAWKQSFALTPDEKTKFDAANKAKNETMKGLQAAKETALEQLSAKVEAKAPDAEVKPTVDAARKAIAAIPNEEDSYWDTLAGILTPTQQAKLYAKGK